MKEILYNLLSETKVLTLQEVVISLIACAVLCILLYISYKLSHSGHLYSKRFAISLIGLGLITDMVMCVIGNNIALSLGMVGALSIVRFRTAIKDARDTMYIFWAIAVGICCGVGDYMIALLGTIAIFILFTVFGSIQDNARILLIVRMNPDASEMVHHLMQSTFEGKAVLRVQNADIANQEVESIYELSQAMLDKQNKKGNSIMQQIQSLEGIYSFSLITQEDEIGS